MINPSFGLKTNAELCEIIAESFSKEDTVLATTALVWKKTCSDASASNGTATGRWVIWDGIIGQTVADRLIVPPLELLLPQRAENIRATVRRQTYFPTVNPVIRDYSVNNPDNYLDFNPALRLNGQKCTVEAFLTFLASGWKIWSGVIDSTNKIIAPTNEILFSTDLANIRVTIRRQSYLPTLPGFVRDFTIDLLENSITFTTLPSLAGQTATIEVWNP
jgi:hypothetical protein